MRPEKDVATLIFCTECKDATMVLLSTEDPNPVEVIDAAVRDFVSKHRGHNIEIKGSQEIERENEARRKKKVS